LWKTSAAAADVGVWRRGRGLFLFGVEFEDVAGFVEVEEVSVDDELPLAGVGRDLVDAFDGVTAVSKLFDEKIDVYIHGDQYTQGWFGGKLLRERYWRCGHPGRFVLSTPENKFAGTPVSDFAPAFGRAVRRLRCRLFHTTKAVCLIRSSFVRGWHFRMTKAVPLSRMEFFRIL